MSLSHQIKNKLRNHFHFSHHKTANIWIELMEIPIDLPSLDPVLVKQIL